MMHGVSFEDAQLLKGQNRYWAYNCLDCVATLEIANVLLPRLNAAQASYYAFCRAAQLPAFSMTNRGMLVDVERLRETIKALKREQKEALTAIANNPDVVAIWDMTEKVTGDCPKASRKDFKHKWQKGVPDGPDRRCEDCSKHRYVVKPFNPQSTQQCAHFLYKLMNIPVHRGKKGEVTTDDDALQRIARKHPKVADICAQILDARGIKKQIGFLSARRTSSDRFPSTFVVGTAWTGRWSSTQSPHREGGNAQNISERHRAIFVADPGYDFCYMDLKQAESNIVAHIAGDEQYIEAHASGDVHTFVTRFIWPDMGWTGDLGTDKKIAKQLPPWDQAPGHDYRFQSKRTSHGSNYGMTPYGIARNAHIPVSAAKDAAAAYHGAFPMIRGWQQTTAKTVYNREPLIFPLGFQVKLVGRPWDDHTVKQGLALLPQGTVAHILNIAAWRVWQEMDPHEVILLMQVHDALAFLYPKGRLDIVKKAQDLMTIPIEVTDIAGIIRTTTIEVETAVGANWGKKQDDNPNGLVEIEL